MEHKACVATLYNCHYKCLRWVESQQLAAVGTKRVCWGEAAGELGHGRVPG